MGLASILVLGVCAQWLAWRFRLPSILLLLLFGFAAGPVTGFLDPDALLGDLLVPVVALSVAVILFEGGLSLRVAELPKVGRVVRRLISLGVLVTWLLGAAAAYLILGLDPGLAVLLGAILVVTGPTVIGPLLRLVRPTGPVGAALKWEGILIDPIGAVLAVLVFEAILAGGFREATAAAAAGLVKTALAGSAVGLLGAGAMVLLLKRYWIPDPLQNPVTLMLVVAAFAASNALQAESGLLAVTVMGVALANQKAVTVKHIIAFKENLRVLLISSLFILLAARLRVQDVTGFGMESLAFLGVLMLVARPAAVALSALGSPLNRRERLFLAWMAPRGIVAAAVSSVFALRLAEAGYPGAQRLVPLTFMVIVATVAVYGLTAVPVARWLRVAKPNPQGVLMVGAHAWARAMARALREAGYPVLLVDANWANVSAARMEGLPVFYGNILSETIPQELDLDGIGRLLALTSNDEVNSLAALHFVELFGRGEVYQLAPASETDRGREGVSRHLRGRVLFGPQVTHTELSTRFAAGAFVKKTALTPEFDYKAFRERYGGKALPLFLIRETGELEVFAADNPPSPVPGQTLIACVPPPPGAGAS